MESTNEHIHELWQREQSYVKDIRAQYPEKFERPKGLSGTEVLKYVGIELPDNRLHAAVIKYHPFDFIVEEILKDGTVISSEWGEPEWPEVIEKNQTVYADMVKVGISTIDAIRDLSRQLRLPPEGIGFAGIKDAIALTSQRISLRSVDVAQLKNFKAKNYFLKNITLGKGVMEKGGLWGNRFTILLRTADPVSEAWLQGKMDILAQEGFWNYFWLQRFGNRLLSHQWGMQVLRGNYRLALNSYLGESGITDLPFFREIRQQASKYFGNWRNMAKVFEPLCFSMRNELALLKYLETYPKHYDDALMEIPEQVTIWVYAYASFLANQMLSICATQGVACPPQLPLLTSNNPSDRKMYESFLKSDHVPKDFEQHLKPFGHNVRLASRSIDVKIKPVIHSWKIVPEGVVVCFDLSKGSYATTFLAHMFDTLGFADMLSSVNPNKVDVKHILGMGDLSHVYQQLKDFVVEKNTPTGEGE